MKITVRNLGMISQAEIDIKPLTILVGPNNAGKTWLAYLLSGIFSPHGVQEYLEAYDDEESANPLPHLEALVNDIISKGQTSVEMAKFVDEQGEAYVNQVVASAPKWIADYLGTNKVDFSSLEINVQFAENKKALQDHVAKASFTNKLAFGSDEKEALLTAKKGARDHRLLFYTSGENSINDFPKNIIKEFVASTLLQGLFQSIYARTYVFPTDRTTFITFLFEEDKNNKKRQISAEEMSELQANSNSRLMSWATGSFLRMVILLYNQSLKKRIQAAQKDAFIKRMMDLAHILQTQLLGGTLDFSSPDAEPGREILFKPDQENVSSMEMSIVSSMVKELAPLVLYLRYLARPRELIIIDEPEMNLHPEAQARLIEFLAMLVNAGLHVLVTTHSPYMVDHLENLMTASEHPEQARKVLDEFFLQNEEAFISKEKVAVYLVNHGTATNIFQDDGHIHWDTFSDVSDKVGGLYSKLLEDGM